MICSMNAFKLQREDCDVASSALAGTAAERLMDATKSLPARALSAQAPVFLRVISMVSISDTEARLVVAHQPVRSLT